MKKFQYFCLFTLWITTFVLLFSSVLDTNYRSIHGASYWDRIQNTSEYFW